MSSRSISRSGVLVLAVSAGLVVAGVIVALTRSDHANATIPAPPPSSTTAITTSSYTPPSALATNSATTPSSETLEIPTSNVAPPSLPASQDCYGLPDNTPDEKQLCDKLQGFVRVYYSRKAGDTIGVIKERLAPYVPENLLASMYIPTEYGDITSAYLHKFKSGSDAISFHLDGNNMSANAMGPDHHVTVRMPIILVLSKPDGSVLSQFTFPSQAWPSTDWVFTGQWKMTRFTP